MKVVCRACRKAFSLSDKYRGKRIKCPGCATPLSVPGPPTPPPPVSATTAAAEDPAEEIEDPYDMSAEQSDDPWPTTMPAPVRRVVVPPVTSSVPARKSRATVPVWVIPAVAVLCLVIGYFAGREHLKHQLFSAFTSAFSEGVDKMWDEEPAAPPNAPQEGAAPAQPAGGVALAPAPPQIPVFQIKQVYRTDTFAVALTGATVGPAMLSSSLTRDFETDEPYLRLSFVVQNVHDRKILTFREASFSSPYWQIVDDVGNVIRGIDFGFSSEVVGAIKSGTDIPPGETLNHIEVFTVPPPKTQSLTLTLNTQAFGGEGSIRFHIPAEAIAGFSQIGNK